MSSINIAINKSILSVSLNLFIYDCISVIMKKTQVQL